MTAKAKNDRMEVFVDGGVGSILITAFGDPNRVAWVAIKEGIRVFDPDTKTAVFYPAHRVVYAEVVFDD